MADMMKLTVLGDRELLMAFERLPQELRQKALRPELRKSAERVKAKVLLNMSGNVLQERTGALVKAFEAVPFRSKVAARTGSISFLWKWPTRAALGIPRYAKDTGYYPTALEYGTPTVPAKAPIRKAVNANQDLELALIAAGVRKRLLRIWKRLNARSVAR